MYSVSAYALMMADRPRMESYAEALRRSPVRGGNVLDLGTGGGVFAILACKLGARRVYAIEPSDVIQLAREIAKTNGCADRIEFIQNISTKVELPERVDIIISDLRGVLPLFHKHIPSIIDARERFLAPQGVLIPQRDTLWATIVTAPELYDPYMSPWTETYGFDQRAARNIVANSWWKGVIPPENVLAIPQQWADLDYRSIQSANASGEINLTITKSGIAHGIAVWFDAVLSEGVGFSNAGRPDSLYKNAFFPLPSPIVLAENDRIVVKLEVKYVGNDEVWKWETIHKDEKGKIQEQFIQSTFLGAMLSPQSIRKAAADFVPELSEEGKVDSMVLDRMKAGKALREIASEIHVNFPKRFKTWAEALAHVGTLSQKYSS